jgi:SAM-dependent methyltransferase
MDPDFGATAADYRTYRAGFPDSLFDRLAPFGIGQPGQRVVDLGAGTGTLARGFARRGCGVIGVDRVARAEATGLESGSADVVSAGQCWHWFDRPAATREVRRLLRPSGLIVIAHFDWIPLSGNGGEATEQLIEPHNPAWTFSGGTGLHPQWLRDLGEGGFREIETFSYDIV